MTRYQECMSYSRKIINGSILAILAVVAVAMAQNKDEADDLALRIAVHEQARQAAQPDAWPKLVAEGCAMVACDRMRPP